MEISQSRQGDVLVLAVKGDIDIHSSPAFRKACEQHLEKGARKLVFNLQEVPYMDSSGLATFVEILKMLKPKGGRLRLSNLSAKVHSLFEITKLVKLFEVFPTPEDCLKDF